MKSEDNLIKKQVIDNLKVVNISNLFGTIKIRKLSGQEFKDMVREGWNS